MFRRTLIAAAMVAGALAAPAFGQSQQQQGLVSVAVGDIGVDALNNTTMQVPVGIAAQVCPELDANVLAQDTRGTDQIACEVTEENVTRSFIEYATEKKG